MPSARRGILPDSNSFTPVTKIPLLSRFTAVIDRRYSGFVSRKAFFRSLGVPISAAKPSIDKLKDFRHRKHQDALVTHVGNDDFLVFGIQDNSERFLEFRLFTHGKFPERLNISVVALAPDTEE